MEKVFQIKGSYGNFEGFETCLKKSKKARIDKQTKEKVQRIGEVTENRGVRVLRVLVWVAAFTLSGIESFEKGNDMI